MLSTRYIASIYLAVLCATGAVSAPWAPTAKLSTHQIREIGHGLKIESFHPESTFETFGEGLDHPLSKRADASIKDSALSFIEMKTGFKSDTVHYRTGYSAETAKHAYVGQIHAGIPFANAVANVAFNHDNKVVSFGSSFVKPASISSSTPSISQEKAIAAAEAALDGKYNDHPITLEYVVKADNTAVLTHVVQIQNEGTGSWYEGFINAHTGELESIVDFVAKATYRVLPVNKEYPTDGFETLTNPEDTTSSPYGWLSTDGQTQSTSTVGNNADAYFVAIRAPQSTVGQFVYNYTVGGDPITSNNRNAAIVNAFYIVNSVHDITYRYGFTEAAYNFQTTNIAAGGKGNDAVKISVQDPSGLNNANFATPSDGSPGQMRMYLWTQTVPFRDGAVENDIVTHEMTHGVTNRMTGGGTGSCLQTTEAGGLGEGWSDAFADWVEQKSATVADYALGQYVYTKNIRTHPYSTSATTNPLRYSSVATQKEVHNIGEVWANILHNVYAALVGKYGFNANARSDPSSNAGNAVYLHLFIDALPLQPCNPTFVSARDAWIQADVNRYEGVNKCLLWRAFASRGLGVDAANYVDSSAVPADC